MRLSAIAPAVVMLALSAVLVAGTLRMGLWEGFTAGPAFFPALIAGFTSVLSVLLLIGAARGEDDGVSWPPAPVLRTVGAIYGSLVAFLLLTPLLGMFPAVVLLLAFVMIVALRQPLLGSLAAIVVTTGFIYLIFVQWLALPLPSGAWFAARAGS